MLSKIYINKYILNEKIGKGSFGEVFRSEYNLDEVIFDDCETENDSSQNSNPSSNPHSSSNPNSNSESECVEKDGFNTPKKYTLAIETEDVGFSKMPVHNRPLAIKRIKDEPRFYKAAQKEIRYLNEINEHNTSDYPIVKLLDSFESENIQYLVFEYLETNLYRFYQKNKISYHNVLKIFLSVARGLEFIHSRNLVHADLKPENIMLDDNLNYIKIIDLGSAFRLRPMEKRKNFYIQSRYYRSPECCFNLSVGKPIDIWSLGCIIYEIISKKPLFPAQNVKYDLIYYFTVYLGIPLDCPCGYNDYFLSAKFREFFRWDKIYSCYKIKVSQPADLNPNPLGLIQKLDYKLEQVYPDVDWYPLKYILTRMVTYDYVKRITATEIVQNTVFNDLLS